MSTSWRGARFLLLALPFVATAACESSVPSEHTVLEGTFEALRSDFEADSGKVRAVFLASPT